MEWKLTRESLELLAKDAIVVFHPEGRESTQGATRVVDEALGGRITRLIVEGEITGSWGEVTNLHNWGEIPATRVLVVGLGKEEKADLQNLKHVISVATRKALTLGVRQLGLSCPSLIMERYNSVDVVQAIVEGVELGSYQHPTYRTDAEQKEFEIVTLSDPSIAEAAFEVGQERGQIFSQATNLARALVHEPANYLTPTKLGECAQLIAEKYGMTVDRLMEERLRAMGMNGLLTVAKGSMESPEMITLTYTGDPESKEVLGLVGKGVTFDSGGLQIKTHKYMNDMHADMAGAAAVLGAMSAIGKLKPTCNVVAVIPTCENGTDGKAYRPGDVITTYSGKTIEVGHTDAEGRIILADAITYAKELGATKLVDVATLTGSVVIALGHETTGLMTNDASWGEQLKSAARIAGERMWELPMFDEYEEHVKSEIADLKNASNSPGDGIHGAMLLKAFAGETPWAHLDIAGTSWVHKEKGIHRKGATGVGVRTLTQLVLHLG